MYAPFSLADGLAATALHLPPGLVEPAAWWRAVAAAERLGNGWSWAMVELHADDPGRVDLLACAAARDAGAGPPELDAWRRGEGVLAAVGQVWCEWDHARVDRPPLCWWGVDPSFFGGGGLSAGGQAALTRAVLEREAPLHPADAEAVDAVAHALDGRGALLGAGRLAARGEDAVRLFLRVSRPAVGPMLAAAGWPGPVALAARRAEAAAPPFTPAYLQLELRRGLTAYLGVEPRQTEPGGADGGWRARWLASLDPTGRLARAAAWSGADGAWERSFHGKHALRTDRGEALKVYLGVARRAAA